MCLTIRLWRKRCTKLANRLREALRLRKRTHCGAVAVWRPIPTLQKPVSLCPDKARCLRKNTRCLRKNKVSCTKIKVQCYNEFVMAHSIPLKPIPKIPWHCLVCGLKGETVFPLTLPRKASSMLEWLLTDSSVSHAEKTEDRYCTLLDLRYDWPSGWKGFKEYEDAV
jgi:hypothetical protein